MANTYEDKKQEALYNYENSVRNAIDESNKTYDSMIAQSDNAYKDQINSLEAQKNNTDPVSQAMKEQTDFAIEKIEQQKAQAQKDYTKEQSAAYVDWKKQINPYGANAEQMASMGMSNTGYSETSKVMMYTAYQNRVAVARESYNTAVQNYNNAMTEARMQNNSALAQIAADALAKQLELSLKMVEQRNDLLSDKVDQKLKIDSEHYSRYQDVLKQIYEEEALLQKNSGTMLTGNNGTGLYGGLINKTSNNSATANGGASSTDRSDIFSNNLNQPAQEVIKEDGASGVISGNNESKGNEEPSEIYNRNGDGWIEIPGHGRFSYTEVLAHIKNGTIKETVVDGKLKYTWVNKPKSGAYDSAANNKVNASKQQALYK